MAVNLLQSPHPLTSPRPIGAATPAHSLSSKSVSGAQSVHGVNKSGKFLYIFKAFNGGFGVANVKRDTSLIGKNVRIIMGQMKGYFGIVKDATGSSVKIELHSQPKVI